MSLLSFEIPISIRWEILKETIQIESQNKYWRLTSKRFYLHQRPGVQYFLEIYQVRGELVIVLSFVMKKYHRITTSFIISIPSANFSFEKQNVKAYADICNIGQPFCTEKELFNPERNYFVNDVLVITFKGYFSAEQVENSLPLPVAVVKSYNLGINLWNREDKDFTFIVKGNNIKVHKLIVSAASSVFDRMIQCGLKESKEGKVEIIDFDYEIIELGLKFCYGIEIGNLITVENGINLLQFADKYDIQDLKDLIEAFLASNLSSKNASEIANASILSNSPELEIKCFNSMVEHVRLRIATNLNILDEEFRSKLLRIARTRPHTIWW